MVIWIASYPRSGNRFFRWVARFRYGLPERTKFAAPPETDPTYPRVRTMEQVIASAEPVMVKTHERPDADDFPAIYVLRDGRDAMVSYTHFALTITRQVPKEKVTPQLFRETMRDLLVEDRSPYGSWSENVLAWEKRPATVMVRYEDMVQDAGGVVDCALAAAGCRVPRIAEGIPTFDSMKKEDARLVRRGQPGSWKDEFPPELLPLFWKRNAEVMRRFGYTEGEMRAAA
ncbi:MAG TPA: sulfotransferase domain-containing protein [Gemmata sp.]|nr:sulfotransferase domain-containing protein [Gemmata sp.]